MQNNERLTMTIPEFAKATGVSKNLAYDLARRGELPVPIIHLGRRMVLSRRAVLALLDGDNANSNARSDMRPGKNTSESGGLRVR